MRREVNVWFPYTRGNLHAPGICPVAHEGEREVVALNGARGALKKSRGVSLAWTTRLFALFGFFRPGTGLAAPVKPSLPGLYNGLNYIHQRLPIVYGQIIIFAEHNDNSPVYSCWCSYYSCRMNTSLSRISVSWVGLY